jgi:uncharacterized protein (UPF0262 family)
MTVINQNLMNRLKVNLIKMLFSKSIERKNQKVKFNHVMSIRKVVKVIKDHLMKVMKKISAMKLLFKFIINKNSRFQIYASQN